MRSTYFKPSTGHYRWLRDHEFVTKVDTVLHQHSGTGVERMEIKFTLDSTHANHIDRWVNFAIASKAMEFVLSLSGQPKIAFFIQLAHGKKRIVREEPYNLTSQLFSPSNGSHLQCLELMSLSLHLPSDFKGFLKLKSLSLVDVSITDEDVQCMLSKCNLLEFFEIAFCRMVTSIRMLHPLKRFKHLVVQICPKLQEIELNCSPTTLKYVGAVVPLIFASTSRLKNISVVFLTEQSALSYIVTGFPMAQREQIPEKRNSARGDRGWDWNLPLGSGTGLELERGRLRHGAGPLGGDLVSPVEPQLRLLGDAGAGPLGGRAARWRVRRWGGAIEERTIVPEGPFKFTYLRNLRKTDVLDYAYLLKIAPFLETLELPMWMDRHRPYCKEDGELRIGLPHKHAHLKSVRISGFFGYKDQVELALYILRNSIALEKMEITPKLEISYALALDGTCYEKPYYVDGYRVATEFVCKADHRNVVNVDQEIQVYRRSTGRRSKD
ncbi:hypothetical protein C2845_PM11G02500 [Panicum miliaceum]|uniref:At1g61320/AtMIF1 LRR domain-containing protein n=1 Tax=Panicum miliaceum TaxID=4540 RepID=A0A3L6RR83_PANMI|nr:hypothetical protein C2845_PM11G02500 [Panicum miliaceum]